MNVGQVSIGQVSKRTNITSHTIWYYINIGLIVPIKRNERYNFREQDVEELLLIKKLRTFDFSLEQIHDILSIYRSPFLLSDRDLNEFIGLLKDKEDDISNEIERLKKTIKGINKIIDQAKQKTDVLLNSAGVDIMFLSLLSCPDCGSPLNLCDAFIQNNKINKGHLKCKCGYEAIIENGILSCDKSFVGQYRMKYSLLSQYDADSISIAQKAARVINTEINNLQLENKIILETNIDRFFYHLTYINELNPEALYIITDHSLEVINYYKKLFDKQNVQRNILFIASKEVKLPIKKASIDIWIDYYDSGIFAEKRKELLHLVLAQYFKTGTKIYGVNGFFQHEEPSYQQLLKAYPNGGYSEFADDNFSINLKKNSFNISKKQHIDYQIIYDKKAEIPYENIKADVTYYEAVYNKKET